MPSSAVLFDVTPTPTSSNLVEFMEQELAASWSSMASMVKMIFETLPMYKVMADEVIFLSAWSDMLRDFARVVLSRNGLDDKKQRVINEQRAKEMMSASRSLKIAREIVHSGNGKHFATLFLPPSRRLPQRGGGGVGGQRQGALRRARGNVGAGGRTSEGKYPRAAARRHAQSFGR